MNVLVLGSGGREHALAWRILQDHSGEVFLHPGNAGTWRAGIPNLGDIGMRTSNLIKSAREKKIDLVVIGPETLLHEGMADTLREADLLVVGPGKAGARLETSKIFAKEFMVRAGIPTAKYKVFESEASLTAFTPEKWPAILKYDGLAAGKGVVIAQNSAEIADFAKRIWRDKEFGSLPKYRVLVEECLLGKELSYIGLCDGESFVPLATATDFKRVGDKNTGANTGGMGAVSPSPLWGVSLRNRIQEKIIEPILNQLRKEDFEFRGVLYVGLMVSPSGDPYVLEFNTRFGDPETQVVMMRWQGKMTTALAATARAELSGLEELEWRGDTAVYVVGAAEGYPGKVTTGDIITGTEGNDPDSPLFFSGVAEKEGELVTGGGRVLGVGAFGPNVESARKKAYDRLEKIRWRGQHYRTDIGLI